jgi:hypothetical protein
MGLILHMVTPTPAQGRPKHQTVYETGKDAQIRMAAGMQAIFASNLKGGKPDKAKGSKPRKR